VARGFVWDPLIPGRDLSSMPSRYLIDWGVCPQKRTFNPDEGRCPTLCLTTTDFRKLTTYRRLYCDFDRSIFANNFHSSSLKSIENFYSRLPRLFSATAKRGRGRGLSAERRVRSTARKAHANLSPYRRTLRNIPPLLWPPIARATEKLGGRSKRFWKGE